MFHEDYALRQAIFLDSKAEQSNTASRIQTDQISMRVKQVRGGLERDEAGGLATTIQTPQGTMLTTTIFAKYHYRVVDGVSELLTITVFCVPNGLLQERYNPDAQHGFWRAGPDAPTLGEAFRVRVSMSALREAATWRVQTIHIAAPEGFTWQE